MSERTRRKARQAKRATARAPQIRDIAPPSPPSSMRSTFKVAAANRQIADQLPSVIRQRSGEKRPRQLRLDRSPVQAATVNAPSDPKKTIASERPAPGVDLRSQAVDEPGKCRPKDNSPKASGGSGRSFHLWKKTC